MTGQPAGEYVLGIDLGSNSLGWAIVGLVDGEPHHLVRAGVRVFDAGMEGDLESGREESRNKARRDARLQRRQLARRARRLKKIFGLLQRFGLLPPSDAPAPERRQDLLNELDRAILASPWLAARRRPGHFPEPEQTLPYILRSAALDEPLEPYLLGRALYHLAQRRGFLSNRKRAPKKADDEGAVKKQISELRAKMEAAGARTLGDYLARLAPTASRIRGWHTHRDMYQREFDAIWAAQAAHRPDLLTPERRKELYKAIFFQRPLWFDRNAVGTCQLEPRERRAPAYLLTSQRFRLLQTVNNLKIIPPGEADRPLTPHDRAKLIQELEVKGDLTFPKVRRLLGLTKEYAFNLEQEGEGKLPGNRTAAEFLGAFGQRWPQMSATDRERAVEYVHAFQKPEKLKEAAAKKWGLDEETADKLAAISLEPDYTSLSRKAMENLLPLLGEGEPYASARKRLYPGSFQAGPPAELLPPVAELAQVRNPAVTRSLTELRKVVNAIIRCYGRPAKIHIELARSLKKPKKQRQAIAESDRRNEEARSEAARKIIAEAGIAQPSPNDKRRYLLAEECRWECPYTGRAISMGSLFGPEPQFDIEHIIPFRRSMDNSFQNLTLCYLQENRSVKGNRTPYQAYAGDPERFEQILNRVRHFVRDRRTRDGKLKRFSMTDDELEVFLSDFRDRQLNDTAYASSLAASYLGLLYGGLTDAEGNRRVQATSGAATGYLRGLWQLNSILDDGPTSKGGALPKSRADHRHHAVDAVVIALTDAAMIKRLSDAAQRAPMEGRRRFASLEEPWPNFAGSVRTEVDRIVVSHRASKKVSGALHEETIYSPPAPTPVPRDPSGEQPRPATGIHRVRKPLDKLSPSEVEQIADPRVREMVREKLAELGGDPKKAFATEANLPFFQTKDGRRIPIKRVRVAKAVTTFALGEGRTARHVASESNHHVEIYAELDDRGNEVKWAGEVVPMYEAYRRAKAGRPVVQRDHGPLVQFKFSLAPGETLECDVGPGRRGLSVVRSVSHERKTQAIKIEMARVNDARAKPDIKRSADWMTKSPNVLRALNARKVIVSPLGDPAEARD